MSTRFTVSAKARNDTYRDTVSKGDVITYEFDCSSWEDDNNTITSATWTTEYGQVAIADEDVTDGVVSANLTFNDAGRVLVSVLLNTTVEKKKLWLDIGVEDHRLYTDDYGFAA